MSVAAMILASVDDAPFSASVFPAASYLPSGVGIRVTPEFTATPSGVGPFTYAWQSADSITPVSPSAASTTYSVQTLDFLDQSVGLVCVVTDTATGHTFSASFNIVFVPPGGRLDEPIS